MHPTLMIIAFLILILLFDEFFDMIAYLIFGAEC